MIQSTSRSPLLRATMLLVVALLTVTACGGNDDDTAEPSGDSSGESETRVVQTVSGEVEIPADPQNIVVDWVTFDNLAVLGHDMETIGDVFELSFFLDNPEFSPERTQLVP